MTYKLELRPFSSNRTGNGCVRSYVASPLLFGHTHSDQAAIFLVNRNVRGIVLARLGHLVEKLSDKIGMLCPGAKTRYGRKCHCQRTSCSTLVLVMQHRKKSPGKMRAGFATKALSPAQIGNPRRYRAIHDMMIGRIVYNRIDSMTEPIVSFQLWNVTICSIRMF